MGVEVLERSDPVVGEEQKPEVLDTKVVSQVGPVKHVILCIRGWHPELGKLQWGLQGQETVIETDTLTPTRVIQVNSNGSNGHRP